MHSSEPVEKKRSFIAFFILYRGKYRYLIVLSPYNVKYEKYFSLDKKWICNIIKKIEVF